MDYENEKFIKVYLRDTADWASMSWQARGLSLEISRKLDAGGEISLGSKGLAAIATLLRAPWSEIAPFIAELVENRRLVVVDGSRLIEPGFLERQTARVGAAARKRSQRDRAAMSRDVTSGHAKSRAVTNVTTRSDQTRSDERETRVARETPPPVQEQPREPEPAPLEAPRPMTLADELTPRRRAMAEAIAANTVPIDADAEWAQYRARRTHEAKHATDADWDGWLRRAVKFATQQRIRDQERRDAPPKPFLVPALPPAPYHARSDEAERERRRWLEDAGSPAERAAASAEAMKRLGFG